MKGQTTNDNILKELREFRKEMRDEFSAVKETLNAHEKLLHTISRTTVETREIVDVLVPGHDDHEERISALERSNIRLRLLIDR